MRRHEISLYAKVYRLDLKCSQNATSILNIPLNFQLYVHFKHIIWLVHAKPHIPSSKWKSAPVLYIFNLNRRCHTYLEQQEALLTNLPPLAPAHMRGSAGEPWYSALWGWPTDMLHLRACGLFIWWHYSETPRCRYHLPSACSSVPRFSSGTGKMRASTQWRSTGPLEMMMIWWMIYLYYIGYQKILELFLI